MTFSTSGRDEAAATTADASAWLLRYARSYPGTLDQVRLVRAFLRESLSGCPRVDDAIAIGSELAANAAVHSRSGIPGGHFSVRAEVNEGAYVLVAVEDEGGPWQARACEPERGHGLDLVQAIAGPGHWGVTGDASGRETWARLIWPGAQRLERELDPPTAEHSDSDNGQAELEKLAAELSAHDLTAHLVIQAGKLPYLAVSHGRASGPPQRIYAQADWFFWPYAERVAACDDLTGAAEAIARALLGDGEASRA